MEKKVSTYNGSAWSVAETRRFLWYNWLMLLELDDDDAVLKKYTWGLDLAGQAGSLNSLEDAGGIGGLLACYDTNATTTPSDDRTFMYFYDANGNVGQLVETTSGGNYGTLAAKYEYDPYGNVTAQGGAYAAANPIMFSTKYFDDETGLGYWGYRYYSPRVGRWLNRDPVGESGGLNLVAYVRNAVTVLMDALGLQCKRSGNVLWTVALEPHERYVFASTATFHVTVASDNACCYCDSIGWIQLVKDEGRWKPVIGPRRDINSNGWRIDLNGDLEDPATYDVAPPWYTMSYRLNTGQSRGKCTKSSSVGDSPGETWAGIPEKLTQEFETGQCPS